MKPGSFGRLHSPDEIKLAYQERTVFPVFGNLRKAHIGALLAAFASLCLVVATAAAQARTYQKVDTPTCSKVGFATVCPTLNTVKVAFTTSKPTKASVSTSVDRSYALMVLDGKAKTKHAITIRSLAPATTYNIKVVASPAKGKPATSVGSFSTGAIGSVPATVTSSGGKLLLNGSPFFPIFATTNEPCPGQAVVEGYISIGANAVLADNHYGGCPQWPQTLHAVLNGRLWWVEQDQSVNSQLAGLPELLNWQPSFQLVSPQRESPCTSTSELFSDIQAATKTRPVLYPLFAARYPVRPGQESCIDATSLNAAFWTSVAAGGQGVEYFTSDAGGANEFDVKAEVSQAGSQAAARLATLNPALGGKSLNLSQSSSVKFGAWQYGGVIYVVAVNTTNQSSTLSLGGLPAGTAVRLWEGGSLRISKGVMSDQFGPQAVHIYRIQPSTKK